MPSFSLEFSDDDPLFCVAFHPEKPQFALGFATGRVKCYEYVADGNGSDGDDDGSDDDGDAGRRASAEHGSQEAPGPTEKWSTKRHKGSCRAIAYDESGSFIVSAGSDGVVKKCDAETGKVQAKAAVAASGATALAVNEAYIVVGDDDGGLHAFDLDLKPHRSYDLEDIDSVTTIVALSGVNKHNFAVGAETRVLRIDLRKDAPASISEDQEDEVLCGCVTSESRSAWGLTDGVLTVWNNRGLMDQQSRIRLTKDGSVDAALAGEQDDHAIAGTSDGWVAEVDLVSGKVLHKARHNPRDDTDEVLFLDYDFDYRLVSGSMALLRVWDEDGLAAAAAAASEPQKKKRKTDKKGKTKKKAAPAQSSAFDDLLG